MPRFKSSITRRRYNLWKQDPHCYYCERELKWEESTLDHVYSKVKCGKYKGRREKTASEVDTYTVLACAPCNEKLAAEEHKQIPRWRVWRRSRSFPKIYKSGLTLFERVIILWYLFIIDYKPERTAR